MLSNRIFGISIDERFAWAVIDIDSAGEYQTETYRDGLLNELPTIQRRKNVPVQLHLHNELLALKQREPGLFEETSAIGISCIGIVQRDTNRLISVARKNWVGQDSFLIDFTELVAGLFGPNAKIATQNDATAKAMAEFHWSDRHHREGTKGARLPVETLCYAEFSEGVNAGIVHGQNGRASPVVRV